MANNLIFEPMGALASLTFLVLLLIPVQRFRASFSGEVSASDFKFGESSQVPGYVSIPNRNYMNLLELPMLFYIICLMSYVSDRVTTVTIYAAWAYVAARALHSLVHTTYNNVFHRLVLFAGSNVILIGMWAWFFLAPRV